MQGTFNVPRFVFTSGAHVKNLGSIGPTGHSQELRRFQPRKTLHQIGTVLPGGCAPLEVTDHSVKSNATKPQNGFLFAVLLGDQDHRVLQIQESARPGGVPAIDPNAHAALKVFGSKRLAVSYIQHLDASVGLGQKIGQGQRLKTAGHSRTKGREFFAVQVCIVRKVRRHLGLIHSNHRKELGRRHGL